MCEVLLRGPLELNSCVGGLSFFFKRRCLQFWTSVYALYGVVSGVTVDWSVILW